MSRILILCWFVFISLSVKAQFTEVMEVKYPNYKDALKAGDDSLKAYKYSGAASAYFNAKTRAKNDEEIATAYMGLAKAIANIRSAPEYRNTKGKATWSEKQAGKARTVFLFITQLPNVSDDTKADAFLAMTNYYKYEENDYTREALKKDNYTQILSLKNISPQMRIKTLQLRKTQKDYLDLLDIKEASDADKAEAYSALAKSIYNTDKKLEYYLKITDLKKPTAYQFYNAIFDAAKIYTDQKKIPEIRKVLSKIDNVDGVPFDKKAQAYRNIGETYFYEKNMPAGKIEIGKVSKIKNGQPKEFVEAFVNNASSYINYQMFKEAQDEYKDALNVKGITDNLKAYVYYNNGNMYYNKSNAAEARKFWDKVTNLKLDSSYFGYKMKTLELIGKSFYAEKNYKEAAKSFKQMVNLKESPHSERLIARYFLGQVLTIDNKLNEASDEYETIIKDTLGGLSLRAQAGMANIAQYKAEEEPKKYSEAVSMLTSVIMFPSFKMKLSAEDKTMYDKLQSQFKEEVRKVTAEFAKDKNTIPYAISIHKSFTDFKSLTDIYELTRHWQALAKIYEAQKNIAAAKTAYTKVVELGVRDDKKEAEIALERLK